MSEECFYFERKIQKLECVMRELLGNVSKLNTLIPAIGTLEKQIRVLETTAVIDNFEMVSVIRGNVNIPSGTKSLVTLTANTSTYAPYPYTVTIGFSNNGITYTNGIPIISSGSGFSANNLTLLNIIDESSTGVYPQTVTNNTLPSGTTSIDIDVFSFSFIITVSMNAQFNGTPTINVSFGNNVPLLTQLLFSGGLNVPGGARLSSLNLFVNTLSSNIFNIILSIQIMTAGTNSSTNINTIQTNIQNIINAILSTGINFIAISN